MKRKVLIFLAMYMILILSTINVAFADYPTYLWGDKNYILCGAHMGYACYIDKSSLVVEEYNPPTYRLAINVIGVEDADRGNTTPSNKVITSHFLYNYDTKKMYTLWPNDNKWHYIAPVGSMAETGHYFTGEMAFYLAYKMKFYGGRQWWSARENRYMSVNFSDKLYTSIDDAR